MATVVDEAEYRKRLAQRLDRIVFDPSAGVSFRLEQLFYPLKIDEGRYAFQTYAEQMEQVHKLSRTSKEKSSLDVEVLKTQIQRLQTYANSQAARWSSLEEDTPEEEGDNEKTRPYAKTVTSGSMSFQAMNLATTATVDLSTGTKEARGESVNLLKVEPQYSHSSLFVKTDSVESRILAIASAGHGKTTLLRRIAIYYCHQDRWNEEQRDLSSMYNLSGNYIPCILQLRDLTSRFATVQEALVQAVLTVFQRDMGQPELGLRDRVARWVNGVRGRLILLVDGLDELSDSMRVKFLLALEDYLYEYPRTPVVMTSRVAGLSDPQVQKSLHEMKFRGRSIMPMTDEEAGQYAERWIDQTQQEADRGQLKTAVGQILTMKKYKYLKELMRTPLELRLILVQIANGTFSSNRYQTFHDTLWGFFTNHVKDIDQKLPVFEDTMTLLGYVAYQMQIRDSMFLGVRELRKLLPELNNLSFHTDLVRADTLKSYTDVLDSLAANVGIIERDDRTSDVVYTFPIRAYQEFLTAHAVCHLRLDNQSSEPTPCEILREHLGDSRWTNIICFALTDLGANSEQDFDNLVQLVFQKSQDVETLRTIIESDLNITRDHAAILVDHLFTDEPLSRELQELLYACMGTRANYAFALALRSAFLGRPDDDGVREAAALALLLYEYSGGRSAYRQALTYLRSSRLPMIRLGATMVSQMASMVLGELPDAYREQAANDFQMQPAEIETMASCARNNDDVLCAAALTDAWLTKLDSTSCILPYLDAGLADVVLRELNRCTPGAKRILQAEETGEEGRTDRPEYKRICRLACILGSFPLNEAMEPLKSHGSSNDSITRVLLLMYQRSLANRAMDPSAHAIACRFYCWNERTFRQAWAEDVCSCFSANRDSRINATLRAINHFALARQFTGDWEEEYYQGTMNLYTRRSSSSRSASSASSAEPALSLPPEGLRPEDFQASAQQCVDDILQGKNRHTDLAFLLRYGKVNPNTLRTGSLDCRLPILLEDEVDRGNPYAQVNLMLYELFRRMLTYANTILAAITSEGWREVTSKFWRPVLWEAQKDPEGALVCVLAQKYGDCVFPDYKEMLGAVSKRWPYIPAMIL